MAVSKAMTGPGSPSQTLGGTHRIRVLDGWRGIAISLVLLDHLQYSLLGRYRWPWTQTGQPGVTIFFVLSGFLITSKLLEGPIDLKRFYVRRFFRLMPVAWAYLATLLVLDKLSQVSLTTWAQIRRCLLFYQNFADPPGGWGAGHFWTLSLEEQFYLVWPCLLLVAGARHCRWIAAAGASGVAVYRWIFWGHYSHLGVDFQTQVRADALLVGCLLALFLLDTRNRILAARWSRLCALPAFAVLLYCIARFHWLSPLSEDIAIVVLMAASILNPHAIFSRPLATRGLAYLGTISYSAYVWQQVFMGAARLSPTKILILCIGFPLCTLGSYYCIEEPCRRFGQRLTPKERSTQNTPTPVPAN